MIVAILGAIVFRNVKTVPTCWLAWPLPRLPCVPISLSQNNNLIVRISSYCYSNVYHGPLNPYAVMPTALLLLCLAAGSPHCALLSYTPKITIFGCQLLSVSSTLQSIPGDNGPSSLPTPTMPTLLFVFCCGLPCPPGSAPVSLLFHL